MPEPTTPRPAYLAPLDGSHLAEAVLPAIERLAERFQPRVLLLHIVEQRPPATIHGERHLSNTAEAEAYLAEVAARLRASGALVETHVHGPGSGDVARSIFDHAQELDASMVVLCTHGSSGLRGILFGSIAQQVLQHGARPVLLIPPGESGRQSNFELRSILVPLDGDAAHEPALPAAAELARVFGAQLHLALVIPTLATLAGERALPGLLMPRTMQAILDLAVQGALDYLERVVAQHRAEGLAVSSEVVRGDPVAAVRELAVRIDADLIAMASHGRAGLDALLSGSVAPRVAGRVLRPLLLVRAADDAES